MTPFERCWLEDSHMMEELDAFRLNPTPCLLHQMGGRFKRMFYFLASRFLSAEDSVLPAEGVHARWQWICLLKRNVRFRRLVTLLKRQNYVHGRGQLPAFEVLRPWISAAFDTEKALYHRVVSNPEVAGNVLNEMYANRFGLSPLDLQLVRDNVAAPIAPPETAVTQWGQSVRFLFEPHFF